MPGDEYFPSDAGGKRPQRDDRRQPSSRGRVPPHNIEAEESVLGALLLSREAIGVVIEMGLNPSDFYKPAHRHIFDAIRSLYSSGAPADTVTVADELRRAGLLAEVGGAETLHELQNTTPSISSAGHYAKIVQETALLRQLIFVAGDIAELAYSEPDDVIKALDMAESKVFNVAEQRVADSTRTIDELLPEVMDRLQETYDRGDTITGVPTGYTDLDELLSGLQPTALNIVGARPAMGKCVAFDTPVLDTATGEVVTAFELMSTPNVPTLPRSQRWAPRTPHIRRRVALSRRRHQARAACHDASGRSVVVTHTHPLLTANGGVQPAKSARVRDRRPRVLPFFGDRDCRTPRSTGLIAATDLAAYRGAVPGDVFRLDRPGLNRYLRTLIGERVELSVTQPVAAQLLHLLLRMGHFWSASPADGRVTIADPGELPPVPAEVWHDIVKAKGERSWTDVSRLCGASPTYRWRVHEGPVPRDIVALLADALDDDQLRWWASPDIVWDEVVDVTDAGWTQVIDFTVPELHNFVAADMFFHNTAFGLGVATHVAVTRPSPCSCSRSRWPPGAHAAHPRQRGHGGFDEDPHRQAGRDRLGQDREGNRSA